jgi:hypothetical protein
MANKETEKHLQDYVENQEQGNLQEPTAKNKDVGPKITEAPAPRFPNQRSDDQISMGNHVGWQKIPIKDLPTQGLFYPEGTEVAIRAASANEIRHWSTLQDDVSAIDDMMNYVIERCVSFKTPGPFSSWKDIKEIDRFYILLGIREYTFVNGQNNLQVKISETEKKDVDKGMIDYINFDEKLMKYYSDQERCFVLPFKSGKTISVSIPSAGVTGFLKAYINRKRQSQEMIDEDFIQFAPFVIKDWRGLNDNSYASMVQDSLNWSIEEISVLTHLKDQFMDAVNPIIRYTDEGGAERTAPLNFHGGVKSIFLISDPFGQLV